MPFTEHAKLVWFGKVHEIPTIRLEMDDGTKQIWNWNHEKNDWFQFEIKEKSK